MRKIQRFSVARRHRKTVTSYIESINKWFRLAQVHYIEERLLFSSNFQIVIEGEPRVVEIVKDLLVDYNKDYMIRRGK